MPSKNYRLIEEAIKNKKQVIANYGGCLRELCPHTLGRTDGNEQALFFQFAGGSRSGLSRTPEKNWRCMRLDEIENIELLDGKWHTASSHSQAQNCVHEIDVVVDF